MPRSSLFHTALRTAVGRMGAFCCVVLCLSPEVVAGGPQPFQNVRTHPLQSTHQSQPTSVRVLLPDSVAQPVAGRQWPVLYVLPVEAGTSTRWGDSLAEVLKHDLHNRHQLICVFPTFADLPWYADHPTDVRLQQERYLLQDVLPLIEQQYPAQRQQEGRLLVGFSKSGWGAWSLLLRHPAVFARAAAFDAPLAMSAPGQFGSGPIYGTADNFQRYQITRLLAETTADWKAMPPRLAILGHGNFARDHAEILNQLRTLQIPCVELATDIREHTWHSGWLAPAIAWLSQPPHPV